MTATAPPNGQAAGTTHRTHGPVRRFIRDHQVLSGLAAAVVTVIATLGAERIPEVADKVRTKAEINVPARINRCTSVEGTASVSEGRGLWLVVRTPNGMFTPLQPIAVDSDGRWTMTRTGIGDDHEAGKEFVFYLISLPQKWADYLAAIDKREALPTLAVLPPDADVLDTSRTMRDGSQQRCS